MRNYSDFKETSDFPHLVHASGNMGEKPDFLEESKSSRVFHVLRIILALATIFGLLYASGAYQYFFYRRTPVTVGQDPTESLLEEEILTVPLTVFILRNNERDGSHRSREDVMHLIENADGIWRQADIQLVVASIFFLEKSDAQLSLFFTNPAAFVATIEDFDPRTINVFLLGNLKGINGISLGGLHAVAVADYTTVYDFRVLAHEVGHALSLSHTKENGALMYQGANYFDLTAEEIIQSRHIVKRLFDQEIK